MATQKVTCASRLLVAACCLSKSAASSRAMAVLPKWAFSLILFAVALLGALLARLAQRKGRVFGFAAVDKKCAVENEAIAEQHPMVNQQLP